MATLYLDVESNAYRQLPRIERLLDKVGDEADQLQRKFKTFDIKQLRLSGLSQLTNAFRTIGPMVGAAAVSFVSINAELEQYQILMDSATGSTEAGAAAFERVVGMSTELPFSIDALADSFVKLTTSGIDDVEGMMVTLADSVAAFGGGSEQLKLVTIAIQQMVGKGVISMEELRRQFGEQVPTAMRAMAQGLGLTMGELIATIETGSLESIKAITAMQDKLNEWHGGAAERRMNSMQGAITRVQTQWKLLIKAIGDGEGAFDKTREFVEGIASALEDLRTSAYGQKLIGDLSERLVELVEVMNDPQAIQTFFQTIAKEARYALDALNLLAEGAKGLVSIVDFFSGNMSIFRDVGAGANFLDLIGMDSDTKEQVASIRREITDISEELEEIDGRNTLLFGTGMPWDQVSNVKDIISNLRAAFGNEQEQLKLRMEFESKEELESRLNFLGSELQRVLDGKPLTSQMVFDAPDFETSDFWNGEMPDFETPMIEQGRKSAEAWVDAYYAGADDIEARGQELADTLADQMKDSAERTRSHLGTIADIMREGMSDEDAYSDMLAQIEQMGVAAENAFKGGNLALYNDLLSEQYDLIKSLSTDGVFEPVSDSSVADAKAMVGYWQDMLSTQTTMQGAFTYKKELEEAKARLKELTSAQEGAGRAIISAEEQRQTKIELLNSTHEKILAQEERQIANTQARITAHENETKKVEEIETALQDLIVAQDEVKNSSAETREAWINDANATIAKIKEMQDEVRELNRLAAAAPGTSTGQFESQTEYRASGGPVYRGSPYVIGEKGPEIFVPNQSGTVVPNNEITESDQVSVNFNFNNRNVGSLRGKREVAEEVLRQLGMMQGAMS